MKRIVGILLCIVAAIELCACGGGGNINNVEKVDVTSTKYTSDDIGAAIETITKEFDKYWKGCTLTKIYYAGDEQSSDYQDWAERNNADEVIVLLSSFDVDSSGGDGSLNPNSTYRDWNWILVRNHGRAWKHVDHGY